MNTYEQQALEDCLRWQQDMQRRPGLLAGIPRAVQGKINSVIPEKIHRAITATFKWLSNALLTGADFIGPVPETAERLEAREEAVLRKIDFYKNAAAAEGALTGAGGILTGLADLPLWLSIKIKMLSDIAARYGHDTGVFSERLYILHILQITFSGRQHRRKVFAMMQAWASTQQSLPEQAETFDWRTFQQEYRDYLDIAKLLQLVPGIGAVVGGYVNHKYTAKLGRAAMNAYRMRWFAAHGTTMQSQIISVQ